MPKSLVLCSPATKALSLAKEQVEADGASWGVQKHELRAVGRTRLRKKKKQVVHQTTSILIQMILSLQSPLLHFFLWFPFPLLLQQGLIPQVPFLPQHQDKLSHLAPSTSTNLPPWEASQPPIIAPCLQPTSSQRVYYLWVVMTMSFPGARTKPTPPDSPAICARSQTNHFTTSVQCPGVFTT